MATPAQIAANRRNALKSTGPRTAAGKAVSSRNALKHGLHSRTLLEAEPVQNEIRQIEANFAGDYPPTTPERCNLLRRLAETIWQKDYGMVVERETWENLLAAEDLQNEPNENIRMGIAFQRGCRLFAKIFAYTSRAQRGYFKLVDALRRSNTQNEPNLAQRAAARVKSALTSISDAPVWALQRCAVSI